MNMEDVLAAFNTAWAYAPFPFLLVILSLLAFAWLWIEYQTTRMGRAIPRYRQSFPVFREVSLVAVWVVRISRTLVWLWLLLFIVLAVNIWAEQHVPDYSVSLNRGVLGVGLAWHRGYGFLVDKLLPEWAAGWLMPLQ